MRKLFAILVALEMMLWCALPAVAQFKPPGGGRYEGSTVPPGALNNVMTSDGTHWTSAVAAGGGGSSPFAPAGFANVSTFGGWSSLAISPDGAYVYVGGALASTNAAIAKVKVSDGTVVATVDLGLPGDQPGGLAISPDGSALYAYRSTDGATWWKIATSAMTVTHTSTLAVPAPASVITQPFDLSPDGTKYSYISGAGDTKLYTINTSTYAVTNQTMNHTAGNLTAVCFYNGSNSNVYVAHAGSGDVDLYAIGGAYASTVSTGAAGTPAFNAMRSGVNGNFFIADSGTNSALIRVTSGTPAINLSAHQIGNIAVNSLSRVASDFGVDICAVRDSFGQFYTQTQYESGLHPIAPISSTLSQYGADEGGAGLVFSPDDSGNLWTLGGSSTPTVWSFPSLLPTPNPSTAGNVQTSDGLGNWISAAPSAVSVRFPNGGADTTSIAVGTSAGAGQNANSKNNVFMGNTAGSGLTTGGSNVIIGGLAAGGSGAITGNDNTAVGYAAGYSITGAAGQNTLIGREAGQVITTGINNTCIGANVAANTLTTGTHNVLIGTTSNIDTPASGTSNTIQIGAGSTKVIGATGCGTPSTSTTTVYGNLVVNGTMTAGGTFRGGADTLVGGQKTIAAGQVTATSVILALGAGGTITNIGFLYEDKASRVPGVSFSIKSSNVLDTENFQWIVIEPLP